MGKLRSDVMKDFTRALSSRYGVSIAKQAISKASLTEKSALTGRTIAEVVGNAKKLRADMLKPIAKQGIRLGEAMIAKSQFGNLSADDKHLLVKFLKRRAVAVEMLGEFPLTQEDYEDFHARATDLVARLRAMTVGAIPANVPADGFAAEVEASLIKAGYRQVLNERPWPLVSKTFSTAVGNRPVEMTSTIAPAEHLGRSRDLPRGLIASGYPQGVHGYMCHSADSKHAVNLAVSKLSRGVFKSIAPLVVSLVRRHSAQLHRPFVYAYVEREEMRHYANLPPVELESHALARHRIPCRRLVHQHAALVAGGSGAPVVAGRVGG